LHPDEYWKRRDAALNPAEPCGSDDSDATGGDAHRSDELLGGSLQPFGISLSRHDAFTRERLMDTDLLLPLIGGGVLILLIIGGTIVIVLKPSDTPQR
jgi:hypothetical protein